MDAHPTASIHPPILKAKPATHTLRRHLGKNYSPGGRTSISGRFIVQQGQGFFRPVACLCGTKLPSGRPRRAAARLTDRNFQTLPIRSPWETGDWLSGLLPSPSPFWAFLRAHCHTPSTLCWKPTLGVPSKDAKPKGTKQGTPTRPETKPRGGNFSSPAWISKQRQGRPSRGKL